MSKYHRNCYYSTHLEKSIGLKNFKQGPGREEFIQTTKKLYAYDADEIKNNPVYRNYFNTHFLNKWQERTAAEADVATVEYTKYTEEIDNDYLLEVPNGCSSSCWIPDQFFIWKWGGSDAPLTGKPNIGTHFQRFFTMPRRRLTGFKQPDLYKRHLVMN